MVLDDTSIRILVLVGDGRRRRRVLAELHGHANLTTRAEDLPDSSSPYLLITDDAQAAQEKDDSDETAVIGLGTATGDVRLPDDAIAAELNLACRLLAEIVRLRCVCRQSHAEQRTLKRLAECDPLTGVANLRAWDAELQRRRQWTAQNREALCVAIVDLDHFKKVNDVMGHAAGDDVLRATARALQKSVREDDFVARLGGDEFGLLISGLDAADAARICERIRSQLVHGLAEFTAPGLTASLGYESAVGSELSSAEELFRGASAALRRAKQAGRNQTADHAS